MESQFKTKLGQLVSWKMGGWGSVATKSHLGVITKIFDNGSVEVTFTKNDWIIIIDPKNLILVNDVADSQ